MASSTTTDRRALRFTRLDEVTADVNKLADAELIGKLRCCGKWTFGQTLNHLARWVDYGFDGVPIKIPFFLPWIMRLVKKRVLSKSMPAGSRIPGVRDGTLAVDVVPTAEALAHFQKAFDRLAKEAPTKPSPLFGPLTHDEWIALHLRHSELHLSFLKIVE